MSTARNEQQEIGASGVPGNRYTVKGFKHLQALQTSAVPPAFACSATHNLPPLGTYMF